VKVRCSDEEQRHTPIEEERWLMPDLQKVGGIAAFVNVAVAIALRKAFGSSGTMPSKIGSAPAWVKSVAIAY
jgi:hypothetical protein